MLFLALAIATPAAAEGLLVQTAGATLPPGGQPIVFSVRTPREGDLTLTLHDLEHRQVRVLLRLKSATAGLYTTQWRGETDGGGRAGAGQAYYPVARLVSPDGSELSWDPIARTCGEPVDIPPLDCRYDKAAGAVRFALSRPARVRLRAGIHHGPLLATLLEWTPRLTGEHTVAWDGKDTTGQVDVANHPQFSLAAQAYSLPEGAVLVEGAPSESTGVADKGAERAARLRKETLAVAGARDPHALTAKAIESPPAFQVELVDPLAVQDGVPVVKSRAAARVTLAAGTAGQMLADRFEIVVYVDMSRVFEEEQAYDPYVVDLDTSGLAPGDHLLSISVASLSDRMSTVTIPFKVTR